MGTRYTFTCHCGYRATVAGDFDIGDNGTTTTIACSTCKKLVDVRLPAPFPQPTDSAINLKPDGCPRGRNHAWRVWTYPGPCPRCGATMKLGEMLSLWD
jgi:hypothetical protein